MNDPQSSEKENSRTAIEALSHEVARFDTGIDKLKELVRELTGEDTAPETTPYPPVGCFRAALEQASRRLECGNITLEELVPRIRTLCLE